ncbi:hypothetical protein ABIE18_000143 [Arthrobacter sp. 2762]
MSHYNASEFEAAALAGHWRAAAAVLSRVNVKPEVLAGLMTDDAHLEVVLGVLACPDLTADHLAWAAAFDNAQILGRVVSNPKTPASLVREIQQHAGSRDGEVCG